MYKKINFKGFSLVELMVTISILMLIISVVVISKKKFGESAMLASSASEMAVGIRQAQVYGVSAKSTYKNNAPNFNAGYGIHVSKSAPNKYVLFNDSNDDGIYQGSDSSGNCLPNTECLTVYKISQGNYIKDFCADNKCVLAGDISAMDVIFKRPNLSPAVKAYQVPSGVLGGTQWSCAATDFVNGNPEVTSLVTYNFPNIYITYKKTGMFSFTAFSTCTACPPGTNNCKYLNLSPTMNDTPMNLTSHVSGSVTLSSQGNFTRIVDVLSSGQISAQ